MFKKFSKTIIGLSLTLLLLIVIAVKASSVYNINTNSVDTRQFPGVLMDFEILENPQNLFAKHIDIVENGQSLHGPKVLLPPADNTSKLDLFILLDASGNTKFYESVIRSKMDALSTYLEFLGTNVKYYVSVIRDSDSPLEKAPETASDKSELRNILSDIEFGSGDLPKAYGLNKLYQFSEHSYRDQAKKAALVITGTPFYDQDSGDETTYSTRETINELSDNNFSVFMVGQPYGSLHGLQNRNTEDGSLTHSLPGGYLGHFSADLTLMAEMLLRQTNKNYQLYYTSDLMPDQAKSASVELYIEGSLSKSFTYENVSAGSPVMTHLTGSSVMYGDPVPVKVEVANQGKMVSEVELNYRNHEGVFQTALLKRTPELDGEGTLLFSGEIPPGNYPDEGLNYRTVLYTPFEQIDGESVSLGVDLFDSGIKLNHQFVNESGQEGINWSWSGPTVQEGHWYELWFGDRLVTATDQKNHIEPVTECTRYQIAKVRVCLEGGKENCAKWSLFSKEAEAYLEDEGLPPDHVTEEAGVQKMIACLNESAYETLPEFISGQSDYLRDRHLDINKSLFYLTEILAPDVQEKVKLKRLSLLYFFMDFVTDEEYEHYGLTGDDIPLKLIYKYIARANNIDDLGNAYDEGLVDLAIRMRGNTSI
jgi:hypothetical protein